MFYFYPTIQKKLVMEGRGTLIRGGAWLDSLAKGWVLILGMALITVRALIRGNTVT